MNRFQINRNGNARSDFIKAQREIMGATHELGLALKELQMLNHGRNYQTVEDREAFQKDRDDLDRAQHMQRCLSEMALRFALRVQNPQTKQYQ